MWPLTGNIRAIFLAVAVGVVFGAGCWVGWKLTVPSVRKAQVALSDQQAQYRSLEAQGKADALQRIKESLVKAEEKDREYQAEIAAIKQAALDRPPRIIRVRCPTPVPSPGGGQAGDPPELTGESANGRDLGSAFRDVDLDGLDRIRDEAKVVSSRLRALQALCR